MQEPSAPAAVGLTRWDLRISLLERVRHSEILPIELGDLCVNGGLLGAMNTYALFPPALRAGIESLRAGRGVSRSSGRMPSVISGFEAVFLTGGRITEREVCAELARLDCPVVFGGDDIFAGVRGGLELLRTRGLSGWVLDLGQSQLKLAAPERRWTFPRDWTRLRAEGIVPEVELPAQRRRLREFIALKLQIAMTELVRRPEALVFGLPAPLDDEGVPQGGGYAGMRGDRMLLPDARQLAGLAGLPLLVLNDAELAALCALADSRLAEFKKVLVLTLGFGIGAALIHRAG